MSAEQQQCKPVEVRHYDSCAPPSMSEEASSDREEAAGKERRPNRFKQQLAWNEMGQNRRNVNIRRITYDVVPTTAGEAEKLAADLLATTTPSTTVDQRLYVRDDEEVESAKVLVAFDKEGNIAIEDEECEQRLPSSGEYFVCHLRRKSKKPHEIETEKQGSEASFQEATAEDGQAAAESPTSPSTSASSTSTAVLPKDDELPAVASQPSASTESIEERRKHLHEEYEAWQVQEEQEYNWFYTQLYEVVEQIDQEPKSTHEEVVVCRKKELEVVKLMEEKEQVEEEKHRETEVKRDDEQQGGGNERGEVEQQEEECRVIESSKWSLTGASTEDEDSEVGYGTAGEDLTQSAASSVQVSSVADADGRQDVDEELDLHESSGKEEEEARKVHQDEENEMLLEVKEGEQPVPRQRRRIQVRCNVNMRLQVRSKKGKTLVKAKLGTVHINGVRVPLPDP